MLNKFIDFISIIKSFYFDTHNINTYKMTENVKNLKKTIIETGIISRIIKK